MGCSVAQVRDRFAKASDFPAIVMLPTPAGGSRPRWFAREVREWAGTYQKQRKGRPRAA